MLPLEEQREERDPRRREADEEAELDRDREWFARRHFPNLSTSVAPRESDETPTFWED